MRCYNRSRVIYGSVVSNYPIAWQVRGPRTPYRKQQSHACSLYPQLWSFRPKARGLRCVFYIPKQIWPLVLPASLSLCLALYLDLSSLGTGLPFAYRSSIYSSDILVHILKEPSGGGVSREHECWPLTPFPSSPFDLSGPSS